MYGVLIHDSGLTLGPLATLDIDFVKTSARSYSEALLSRFLAPTLFWGSPRDTVFKTVSRGEL